jgi:sulfopropanediol 3-dehydrogenase
MARYLKTAPAVDRTSERDREVRETVTSIIEEVAKRGDVAVHELSRRFDKYDRADFRLTAPEIDGCLDVVGKEALEDIRFAQAQVRRFAEVQRTALLDVEVETLPGIVRGTRTCRSTRSAATCPGASILCWPRPTCR